MEDPAAFAPSWMSTASIMVAARIVAGTASYYLIELPNPGDGRTAPLAEQVR